MNNTITCNNKGMFRTICRFRLAKDKRMIVQKREKDNY